MSGCLVMFVFCVFFFFLCFPILRLMAEVLASINLQLAVLLHFEIWGRTGCEPQDTAHGTPKPPMTKSNDR